MSDFLKTVNNAGLIEKLDGNDERFAKMEAAAKQVAKTLQEDPSQLIRAVLAGLDPDIPADDPAIEMAEKALIDEWTSLRSVHPDPPKFICRAILLDACDQVADGINTVILWNTVADTLPLMRLGKEEISVREMLARWAESAEEFALVIPTIGEISRAPSTKTIGSFEIEEFKPRQVDHKILKKSIATACGPSDVDGETLENSNRYWSNNGANWCYEFTDLISNALRDRINAIYRSFAEEINTLATKVQEKDRKNLDELKEMHSKQRTWMQGVLKNSEKNRKAEHLRLNTLWWCEALYSPTMRCSYRELEPISASALMAIDLLDGLETPIPASVGYALAETVNKLPEMAFGKEYDLREVLEHLAAKQGDLPPTLKDELMPPPEAGRLSLRDLLIAVMQGDNSEPTQLMKRAGLADDHKTSLPKLAQALFRQEQAVRLAEG